MVRRHIQAYVFSWLSFCFFCTYSYAEEKTFAFYHCLAKANQGTEFLVKIAPTGSKKTEVFKKALKDREYNRLEGEALIEHAPDRDSKEYHIKISPVTHPVDWSLEPHCWHYMGHN